MKHFKPLALGFLAVLALSFFAAPSAQAGTRVNISFGGGYCPPAYYPRPVVYYQQPCYPPVVYQPAYYPAPRPVYYQAPVYRSYPAYGYGYARPAYYPGCR